jgi:hypothetical protein
MMMKISIPVQAGNARIKDGSLPKTVMGFVELEDMKKGIEKAMKQA